MLVDTTLLIAFLLLTFTAAELSCQNGGTPQNFHCFCKPQFVGEHCQIPAQSLDGNKKEVLLTQDNSYFYFEPKEINFYRMNFTVCMIDNPSQLPVTFFIETELVNGALRETPTFFETFKLIIAENGCVNFSTHYISIKRREDSTFRKVVIGMKSMGTNDKNHYFNVLSSADNSQKKVYNGNNTEVKPQKVSIQFSYDLYLQTNYYGSFILLMTTIVLISFMLCFISYIRKKYIEEQNEEILALEELRNEVRRNNPERDDF